MSARHSPRLLAALAIRLAHPWVRDTAPLLEVSRFSCSEEQQLLAAIVENHRRKPDRVRVLELPWRLQHSAEAGFSVRWRRVRPLTVTDPETERALMRELGIKFVLGVR